MARTRKSIQPLNLYKYDVLIEDKATRSDYFKVTQFDGNFYGGRNAFLLAGTGVLRPNSKILVEILNKDGTTVYSAPITSFIEGNSRLVQIEVYSDTPIGAGKIVLLGCADTYLDGTPVPTNWQGKYNVRWIADVIISPLIENKTPIRFEATPSIVATEKFYYTPSSSQFVEQIKVPVDIELTPKYYNVFPNGYLAKIRGPNNTKYNSDYLGGAITGAIALSNGTISTTASINIPITKIYNSTLGESQGTLIYINNTLFSKGILSSSAIYTTEIEPFGLATISSSINIQYNKLTTLNTGSAVSFAKLRLVDLKTISGEIHKIRLSYKATTEPGEFVSLGDINTTVAELLAVDSSSRIAETGQFTDIKIDDYWYSETMSLQKNEANPTLPTYYISSSLSSSYLAIVQSSATALDSITATPQIVNGRYINDVSYFIGTKNTNTIQVFPRVEYTLAFDATVSNTSASVALNQTDYSLEVYLVAEAGYSTKLLDTNPRGQLLGTLTPTSTFQRQNFEGTEFNFIPKIIANGNFGLRFIAYGGFWNIGNVSVKAAQEPFFSPDEINILIPNANYTDSILTFRAQYLDVNNNSIGINTFSTPTYFTGSGTALNSGTSISVSYAATSSIATSASFATTASYVEAGAVGGTVASASYAATSSNLTGGVANYIPLWTSATAQSSSNIYQSDGNVLVGGTTSYGLLTLGGTSATAAGITQLTSATFFNITPSNTAAGGVLLDTSWVAGGQGPLRFAMAGAEVMRLDSSGRLGIGVTPSVKLEVGVPGTSDASIIAGIFGKTGGNRYGSTVLRVARDTGTTDLTVGTAVAALDLEYNSGGEGPFRYGTYFDAVISNGPASSAGPYGAIHFATSGSIGMTIGGGTLAGKVGIGTTSPTLATLQVAGSILSTTGINISGNGGFYNAANKFGIDVNGAVTRFYASGPDATTVGSYEFHTIASDGTPDNIVMTITNAGNVGIGTTAPGATLQVQGNVSASSYTSSISNGVGYFGTSSFAVSASWAPSTGGGSGTVTSIVAGSGLSGGTITSAGTISLDTSSAHFTNGVKNKLNTEGVISSSAQQVVSTYTSATDNRVLTSTGVGGINAEPTLTYDGTVLSVSTNNARYFQGGDDAALYDVNVANTLGVYGAQDSTVGAIKLGSSGQTLYSNATGLGIGTTSPGAKLHVVGNATITGSLILSSSAPTELQVIGNTELTGSLSITGSTYIRPIIEHVVGTSSAPPATLNYNVLDGAILFHSGSATANWTLNFRGNASTTLNSIMPVSSSMTVTLLTRTTTAYSSSAYQIDGSSITPRWQGGVSGSGNANSIDAHTFTIIKISSTPTYLLLGSITKYT